MNSETETGLPRSEASNGDKTPEDMTFEEAIGRLEAIVARLESGDVPLEQAIELFQEGMRLSRLCADKLNEAERRIELLVETEAGLVRKPFDPFQGKGDAE